MTGPAARLAAGIALVVALSGLAACGADPATPTSSGYGPGSAVAGSTPAAGTASDAAVPEALRFTGTTLDGAPFDAADLAGRPVLLWFWAPWCPTCAGQAPSVARAAETHGDRVAVLGVGGLDDEAAMRDFVTDFDLGGLTMLADSDGVIWKKFQITQQSLYVLIDADGVVRHSGWLDSRQLADRVAALAG